MKFVYLIDTSVLIQAHRNFYAFDLVPSFWDKLKEYIKNKNVLLIDQVKKEIEEQKEDLLTNWLKNEFDKNDFVSTDSKNVKDQYDEIINWIQNNPQFNDEAKADFANGADGWLIAYAKVNDCIVVTQEKFHPDIRRKVPIPNVCKEFEVEYINLFEMLRRLRFRV